MKSNNTCVGHNSEHLCQVWLNSVQCFPSRPWKCCFTYGFKANFDLRWQRFWISDGLKNEHTNHVSIPSLQCFLKKDYWKTNNVSNVSWWPFVDESEKIPHPI